MGYKRIRNILLKEWQTVFTDINSIFVITLLPVLIVGQSIAYIWLADTFGGDSMLSASLFQSSMSQMVAAVPQVALMDAGSRLRVLLLSQFNLFLLLIPTMIAVSIATFTIVDEKVTGSLEALLATPVRTWELLLGKALAGAVPALIMTWVSAGIFLIVVTAIGWGTLVDYVLTPAWFISLFLITPAITLLSFTLGVIGSARARDAKSAQNLVVFIVLPVMALIVVQVTGLVWFTPLLSIILALAIGIIDYIVLQLAVRLFQRESILIQWR